MYSIREISPDVMWKPARNKGKHTEGQCMETLGSAWECDWVVGLQILTPLPLTLTAPWILSMLQYCSATYLVDGRTCLAPCQHMHHTPSCYLP